MLIDRADRYGLAQLYQLRGRVGRSDKPASCWLLVPPGAPLSDDARRRLRVLQEFSDLGAGFRIAAKDLEIRGAGSILGAEQSGHIESVGFETYVRLLEEAMAEVKGEPVPETRDVTLQLGLPLALPPSWIPDESLRMALYKRIAAAADAPALEAEASAAADRYGAPPPAFARLLDAARLRLFARALGVKALQRRGDELHATLEKDHRLDPDRVLASLKRGELFAAGPDAFRVPAAFAGLSADGRDVCARTASTLAALARKGRRRGRAGAVFHEGGRMRLHAPAGARGRARPRSSSSASPGATAARRIRRRARRSSRWSGERPVAWEDAALYVRKATGEDPKNVSPRVASSLLDQYLEELLLERAVEDAVPPPKGDSAAERRRELIARSAGLDALSATTTSGGSTRRAGRGTAGPP